MLGFLLTGADVDNLAGACAERASRESREATRWVFIGIYADQSKASTVYFPRRFRLTCQTA
jgi:hypothetical protein